VEDYEKRNKNTAAETISSPVWNTSKQTSKRFSKPATAVSNLAITSSCDLEWSSQWANALH
jgi:hypothetical protein